MIPFSNFRGHEAHLVWDDFYDVPIRRFSSIRDVLFDPDHPARYLIVDPQFTLPIDILLYPRKHQRLLVGFHGAEERKTYQAPKFQFVRSFTNRPESLMFISDTTLLQSDAINIGWCAGNKDTPLAALLSRMVRAAGVAVDATETLLAGHSAGGFSAILVGSQVPNSHAVAMNAQSVVQRYEPWTVRNLHAAAFPECATIEEMTETYAPRLDLRVGLKDRLPGTSFTLFANRTDQASFGRLPHFPLLAEAFGIDQEAGGRTPTGDAFVPCEWGDGTISGHALPGTIMPFLELALGERPGMEISHQVDPTWTRAVTVPA